MEEGFDTPEEAALSDFDPPYARTVQTRYTDFDRRQVQVVLERQSSLFDDVECFEGDCLVEVERRSDGRWYPVWPLAFPVMPPDLGVRIVTTLGEPAARELLEVLTRSDVDRAALIGRLHRRKDAAWLAELLMDIESDPDDITRLNLITALRAVVM